MLVCNFQFFSFNKKVMNSESSALLLVFCSFCKIAKFAKYEIHALRHINLSS